MLFRRLFTAVNSTLLGDLFSRGLIAEATRPEILTDALLRKQVVYAGVDPTAPSLHVGHLLPMLCLLHFHLRGHKVIPLIGGATGLVGDPSGRMVERNTPDSTLISQNVEKLKASVELFFSRAWKYSEKRFPLTGEHQCKPTVLNNLNWLRNVNLLEFLRTVGPSVRVNTMLNRESVKARMDTQQGISFTEFTYQLLQAYDFYILHTDHNCTIQIGGSDQWGNILAGIEMINRLPGPNHQHDSAEREKAFGITTPLLTTPSGEKFGKSAGNAVWLDEQMTSVFDFYQFFVRTRDADVEKYLKMFTLLPLEKISDILQQHRTTPEHKLAQRLLADELTELVHTDDGLRRAHAATKILFGSDHNTLTADEIISAFAGNPRLIFGDKTDLMSHSIAKLSAKFNLVASSSAAWNLINNGGLYVNNQPVKDVHAKLIPTDFLDGRTVIMRAGKDKHVILALK